MKRSMLVTLALVVCVASVGVMFAQDVQTARPMFAAIPPHSYYPARPAEPAAQLTQFNLTWKSSKTNTNFTSTIVGTDPTQNNSTTTVTIGVIPIKMVYGANNGNMTFDPGTPYVGNYSTTQMFLNSPMLQNYIDFNQGGTDLGNTQYIDAYTRGNFWASVQTNTNYHLILKPVLGPTQTINVSVGQGNVEINPLGGGYKIGTMDINAFDSQLQTIIRKYSQIQPNVLPFFITYNVYLTSGGCCIGGYHSANGAQPGGQTYGYTTIMAQNPNHQALFAQDVSAAAHELGEWQLDPFVDNRSPCPNNGILENGDPLENNATYGQYPYTYKGFTFHPQDLVFLSWFGQTPSTAVNGWTTFQNEKLGVCIIN